MRRLFPPPSSRSIVLANAVILVFHLHMFRTDMHPRNLVWLINRKLFGFLLLPDAAHVLGSIGNPLLVIHFYLHKGLQVFFLCRFGTSIFILTSRLNKPFPILRPRAKIWKIVFLFSPEAFFQKIFGGGILDDEFSWPRDVLQVNESYHLPVLLIFIVNLEAHSYKLGAFPLSLIFNS